MERGGELGWTADPWDQENTGAAMINKKHLELTSLLVRIQSILQLQASGLPATKILTGWPVPRSSTVSAANSRPESWFFRKSTVLSDVLLRNVPLPIVWIKLSVRLRCSVEFGICSPVSVMIRFCCSWKSGRWAWIFCLDCHLFGDKQEFWQLLLQAGYKKFSGRVGVRLIRKAEPLSLQPSKKRQRKCYLSGHGRQISPLLVDLYSIFLPVRDEFVNPARYPPMQFDCFSFRDES